MNATGTTGQPWHGWLAAAFALTAACACSAAAGAGVREFTQAERTLSDGSMSSVTLPDEVDIGPNPPAPLRVAYRWSFDFDPPPSRQSLYFSGLIAHVRIRVNDHVLADHLSDVMLPLPRKADRIVLLQVPDAAWKRGANRIELEAAGQDYVSVSAPHVGPDNVLAERRRWLMFGAVIGPAIVAAVMGTLGAFMLVLSSRRRESLYGYFGAGMLAWSLHNAWTVLPWYLLAEAHYVVWWTSLLTFFVSMIAIFCVRVAEWHMPGYERLAWATALSAPLVLYAAWFVGHLDTAAQAWRLGLLTLVSVAMATVGHAAFFKPGMDAALVAMAGAFSLAFGLHDWVVASRGADNNPVFLVPYAGLFFVVFVVRMLVDRFVRASHELALVNLELEQRVESRSLELRHAVEQMRLARNAAEAADRAKTSFLAAASHDLRQPAHALGLYMAALRAEPLAAAPAELVHRMSDTLVAMDTMFNALLDISRIDAGAVVPEARRFAIEPMLRRLVDEFAPQSEGRGLRLELWLPSRPTSVDALSDVLLVERILRNLIANAVKYTLEGGIVVACRARRAHWRVEVWDTGIGIAPGDRERIFEEFVQLDNPGRQRAHGLGLGLAIVRRLVDLLGLSLQLESRPGRGSRFTLWLPRHRPLMSGDITPASYGDEAESEDGHFKGMVLAVIEDDAEVRHAMHTLLQRWGCSVVSGECADDILERCSAAAPVRAVIADYRLAAGLTGPQEVARLGQAWQRRVPALIVTGDAAAGMVRELQAAGFPYLHKPVAPGLLKSWLERVERQHLEGGAA